MKLISSITGAIAGLAAFGAIAPSALAQDAKAYDTISDQVIGEMEKFTGYFKARNTQADCRQRCIDIAYKTVFQANQTQRLVNAGEFVLSQAQFILEEGVKVGSAATGTGAIVVSGYAMMKCGIDFDDNAQFFACLAQETVGYYAGSVLPEGVTSATLQRIVDIRLGEYRQAKVAELTGKAKKAVQVPIEGVNRPEKVGDCTSQVRIYWDPRPRKGHRGGIVTVTSNGVCNENRVGASAIKSFEFTGVFPLNLDPGPKREAGWAIDKKASFIRFNFVCGGREGGAIYDLAGNRKQFAIPALTGAEGDEPKPTPTPTPTPMTEEEKKNAEQADALERLEREEEYVCETCQPQEDAWNRKNEALKRAEAGLKSANGEYGTARSKLQAIQDAVAEAERNLAEGAGESNRSNNTDYQGRSYQRYTLQGKDGRVTVITKVDGKITRTEDKGYAPGKEAAARALKAAQEALPGAKQAFDLASQRRDAARKALEQAKEELAAARKELDACRERARCEFGK